MKKDWHIVVFLFIYLNVFTIMYSINFHELSIGVYHFLLITFMIINIPSLLSVLILLGFERLKNKQIHESIYLILSLTISSIIVCDWNRAMAGPKNVFPILEEPNYQLFLLCLLSNIIAYIFVKILKIIAKKHRTQTNKPCP